MQATISFYDPLADPTTTSALRPWAFSVSVGDYLNGICTGDSVGPRPTHVAITGSLADPAHAALDSYFDFGGTFADAPVAGTLSPDRTQLTLAVTDPRLSGLNPICADAGVQDTRQSKSDFSRTFAFLLDGYDAADGALSREVARYVSSQARTVAAACATSTATSARPCPAASCTRARSPARPAARSHASAAAPTCA